MKLSRVHWFLHYLDKSIYRSYRISYDYVSHNYFIYRNIGYKVLDCFTIVRTSIRCWRCMYYNSTTMRIDYFSCRKSKTLAKKIKDIADVCR